MRRRTFIAALGGAAVWPLVAQGQQPGAMRLIGVLWAVARTGHATALPTPRDECAAFHSITSSARARSEGGIVRPSALAVLKLMTNSSLVGNSTGKSLAFAPLNIWSKYQADR